MDNKMTQEKIDEILSDNETSKKISLILNVRQQERFLNSEKERLRFESTQLEAEITSKYKLGFIDVALLLAELEKTKFIDWYKDYKKKKGV